MMMNEQFLLNDPTASALFHETAEGLPVVDFHNHLSVEDLVVNAPFRDLSALWLDSDPYKHRAMRIAGIPENLITGRDASPFERFQAWAAVVPQTVGNPLYHWSMLELKRLFDWNEPLTPANARTVWNLANDRLAQPEFTPVGILQHFRVEYAAPCCGILEDPFRLARVNALSLVPSLRADDFQSPTPALLEKFSASVGFPIHSFDDYQSALERRIEQFHQAGCRFADHALNGNFHYRREDGMTDNRFRRMADGEILGVEDGDALSSAILRTAAACYARRHWVWQLHIGAERYTSSRLRRIAGPAGGFAGIAHPCDVTGLCALLDDCEQASGLPQTILYTLNPADNAALAVLTGSFSEDGIPGKVQFGPAWWYNDHLSGMRSVWESLSSFGLLSTFAGMTTDSRSLLSFARHEYFRRAFCNYLAGKVEAGEYPDDPELLHSLVRKVCYGNIKSILERISK